MGFFSALSESKFIPELCKQIEKRQSASIKNVKDSAEVRQERGDELGGVLGDEFEDR